MATLNQSKACSNTAAADFRAWAQFIHDAIVTTSGWVDTAATGQVDLTTMVSPGSPTANTYVTGHKVYRMDDSLQGTFPCFLKLEFGNGNGASFPSLRITVGTAHDGAGTLTGTQVVSATVVGANAATTSLLPCYASGDTGRIAITMFAADASRAFVFGVERSKASDGTDNGDCIVFAMAGHALNAITVRSQTLPPSGGMPPSEPRWTIPYAFNTGGSEYNTFKAMGLLEPWMGKLLRPVMNWGMLATADYIVDFSTIDPTVYGAAHTYIAIGSATGPNQAGEAGTLTDHDGNMLMRYE